MSTRLPARSAPLILGVPVQFRDRWQGRLTAIEVDETWEVLNLVVRGGLLRWSSAVKLPFSASTGWSDHHVAFDCTSRQAFAREVPPIAAPARPLSKDTPLSLPGAALAGLLVERSSRRAGQVIITASAVRRSRVPVADVSFEGKVMRIAAQAENLAPYLTDEEIALRVRHILARDGILTGEERGSVIADVSSGVVTLSGNVRTKRVRERIEALAAAMDGASGVRNQVVDDIELELAIGQALSRSGLQRRAEVYARSMLGEVTLFGSAASAATVDDVVRVVSAVPGVRTVRSLIAKAA